MSRFTWAPTAYRLLNGIMCVYKPDGLPVHKVVETLKWNLARDLNKLPCYTHEIPLGMNSELKENHDEKSVSVSADATSVQDWSEHRLVLGERYLPSDFRISFVDGISRHTTGVLLLGIGNFGRESVATIAQSKFLRVNHIKGRLGWATDNFSPRGRILERARFKHVNQSKLDKVCALAQASHAKMMHVYSGVNPDSQEAYEMAAEGIIRPSERDTPPVLYRVRCIDFQPPDFTLEVHSINEKCFYLRQLVHDLALKLKTAAVCTGIRRLRYGHFTTDRALVRQQWNLEDIMDNIEANDDLLTPERLFVGTAAEKVKLLPVGEAMHALPGGSVPMSQEDEDNDKKEKDVT